MSNLSRYIAFVDETGTNALDTSASGESNLFICTAVLVKEFNCESVSKVLSGISSKYCGGAEIKSSKIGKNHARRMQILKEVSELEYSYYALVVNKDSVDPQSGLQFKKTFYKRINRMIYERVGREFGNLHVVADTIGGQEYMASFDGYLKNRRPNLISCYSHEFRDSKATPLLQLADLITGTLSFCFVASKKGEHSEQFRRMLSPKELYIEAWPPLRRTAGEVGSCTPNEAILNSSRNRAIDFVEENSKLDDEFCRMQATVVQKLLFNQFFDFDHGGCQSASNLRGYLENLGFERLSEPTFRSKIIGKIRDAGVILSGTSKGYRLAVSEQDIQDYLDHNKNIIGPMLNRLKRAQTVIKADLGTATDILDAEGFRILKSLVECYSEKLLEELTTRNDQR